MSVQVRSDHIVHTATSNVGLWRLAALAVLMASTACTGGEPLPVEMLVRKGDVYLDPETLEPYSGPAVVTFANRMASKETYHDGVKHGPYEWYFANGRLFERGTYHDGHLDGRFYAYWGSIDLYEEGAYLHGEFDGPRTWYLAGELIELVTYRNGIIEGAYERYREDGTLDLKGTLFGGEPCGVWFEGRERISYPECGTSVTE